MSYAQWPLAPQTPLCFFFCCATEHAKLCNSYVNWSWNQPYQPYQPTPRSTCPLGRYLGPLEVELSWSDPLGQSLKSSCKELGHFETGPSLARSTHLPSCFQPRQDLRYHWALLACWFFYCNSFGYLQLRPIRAVRGRNIHFFWGKSLQWAHKEAAVDIDSGAL